VRVNMGQFQERVFLGFVVVATAAMAWVASPFYGAILWALTAAIVFAPVNAKLAKALNGHRNTAAGLTLVGIVAMVIVPAVIIGSLLVEEAIGTYQELQKQPLDIGATVTMLRHAVPSFALEAIDKYALADIDKLEERISAFLTSGLRIAAEQAVNIGQSAFGFVVGLSIMLYLTYFLLRDGRSLAQTISRRIPMAPAKRRALFEKFITVIRATIKGSIVVAIAQGLVGGLTFYFLDIRAPLLWGVVMGMLSLVPAIGTGLVWVPVAIYLLATGDVTRGVVLFLVGFFVISMIDNILRPILVGKDTRMPDYVVLISTLGGIGVMGINGFITGPVIAAMFMAAWDIFSEDHDVAKAA
jgi:predicted PurR-regulated permease PerM